MDFIIICRLCRRLVLLLGLSFLHSCVEQSQNAGDREGVSDCLNLDSCPDLDGVVAVGSEDFSREGQPGSEKYKESSESLNSLFHCQSIAIVGAGGDSVMVRSSLEADFTSIGRVSEGTRLSVQEVERQGPQIEHDTEPLRRSTLWYKVLVGENNQTSGWLTAVYTRCVSK